MPAEARPDRFDTPPATEEGRQALLAEIGRQSRELVEVNARVTCPCGRKVVVIYACRCYHCGIFFCPRCCARHFGPAPVTGMEVERA